MFSKKNTPVVILIGVLMFLVPSVARAVIPPDFIFNIGSHIIQAFSIIILFISAVFVSVYQFIKFKFTALKHSRVFWVASVAIILVGSFGGALMYALYKQEAVFQNWLKLFRMSVPQDEGRKKEFFYDRIIVQGYDKTNQPFLLFLEMSRKQTHSQPQLFGHTYQAKLLYRGEAYDEFTVFTSSSSGAVAYDFLTAFTHSPSEVLPVHEYYFALEFDKKKFVLHLNNINSDFVVKNTSLDYIRFVSAGNATMTTSEGTTDGVVMVDNILSVDARAPTLEGYEVKRVSHSAMLWDEDANFYHFDFSEVSSRDIPYTSHKWILFKDSKNNFLKKLYDARLNFDGESKNLRWIIEVPELDNRKFDFSFLHAFSQSKENAEGYVEGVVVEKGREKKIRGYIHYVDVP